MPASSVSKGADEEIIRLCELYWAYTWVVDAALCTGDVGMIED